MRNYLVRKAHEHPVLARSAAVLLGSLVLLDAKGLWDNRTFDRPAKSCVSDFWASPTYQDKQAGSTLLVTDTGFFTTGVIARTTLTPTDYGVEAGYRDPTRPDSTWHTSGMLKPDQAGGIAVKFAIGTGPVEFGLRTVAPKGSPSCELPPEVSFQFRNPPEYLQASGALPWENPVSAFISELSGL
jgi:hypothetical protein